MDLEPPSVSQVLTNVTLHFDVTCSDGRSYGSYNVKVFMLETPKVSL